jgi:hypothetical protein
LGSEHRRRQALALLAYAAVVAASSAGTLVFQSNEQLATVLLGAGFPGAGFLHWAGDGQLAWALVLFGAALLVFALALVLWIGTGNVLAPIAAWASLAWLAAEPAALGINLTKTADWPTFVGPGAVVLLAIRWLRRSAPVRTRPRSTLALVCLPDPQPTPLEELSLEKLKRLRLLLDRALQPLDRFDGFEKRDQFQTAALRYQVNFIAYALASAARHYLPAADHSFVPAQERLLAKVGDRRLWRYWRLENAWGNLRLGADPVAHQNIMFSGFTLLQMALGGNDTLTLHDDGHAWRRYELDEIAGLLERQYRASRFGLLACEPNWIYPLCNLITMTAIKAVDARLGAQRWPVLADRFLDSLQRECTRSDGSFIAFRSTLTGVAPPSPGGIVMQAFPCLFLNALSPELAQEHWHEVRRRLDSEAWPRLFWPLDVGNYGFSRASSYAATAAAAVEMGDVQVAHECLRLLEQECSSRALDGVIHRERSSLWAHALEMIALCGRKGGLAGMTASAASIAAGPRLLRISCPRLHVASALTDGTRLDLVFQPGGGGPMPSVEIGGLVPGGHYHTDNARWPLLMADQGGRGIVRLPIEGRTALSIRPVHKEARH